MKRTQSKAVKPARKAAVKWPTLPEGWRWVHPRETLHVGDCTWATFWVEWVPTPFYGLRCGKAKFYIRRNPRAARANKGRKV